MSRTPYHKGLWCSASAPSRWTSRKRASSRSLADIQGSGYRPCRLEAARPTRASSEASTDSCSRRPCDQHHVAFNIAHYFGGSSLNGSGAA